MIDVAILRKNPELFRDVLKKGRGNPEKANVDEWLQLDKKKKKLELEIEELRAERNKLAKSKEIAQRAKDIKQQLVKLEAELTPVAARWKEILDWMPNLPLGELKPGKNEADNTVLKAWRPDTGYITEAVGKNARGETEQYFPQYPMHGKNVTNPKHHVDLGKDLGIIDVVQGSKVSGTRFTYLLGDLVLLQYAIQQLLFAELLRRSFIPIIPPLMVKERALYGSSHFPEGKDQIFEIKADKVEDESQLFLLGSTEPANFAYFMDKIIPEDKLPIKIFAYAPAFRSEVGSWGKDTKGIKRVHQFDKIEMNAVTTKDQSEAVYQEFMDINEWLLQNLEIPYQLVEKCAGDLGYLAAAKQMDPEYWLGGQKEFMEMGTDSNTTDYQARRLNIRAKRNDGVIEFAHTVNDTGIAMGRCLIAILDNYQQEDGTVFVPKALQEIMGKEKLETNKSI